MTSILKAIYSALFIPMGKNLGGGQGMLVQLKLFAEIALL